MRSRPRPGPRRLARWPAALAAALLIGVAAPASAQPPDSTPDTSPPTTTSEEAARQAALEIAAARERANRAAEDYFVAEGELAVLDLHRRALSIEVTDLEMVVSRLERAVTQVAVNRYMSSGSTGIPVLTDVRQPTSQQYGDVLARAATEASSTALDDYDQARDELDDARAALDDAEADVEVRKVELLALQAEAEAEVQRLRDIEEQRLHDEAVQAALAALRLEQQRQLAELQRREAEAQRIIEEERDAAIVGATAIAPTTAVPIDDDGDPDTPPVTAAPVTMPPVDPGGLSDADDSSSGAQISLGASGGLVGGRTGGGGTGSNPRLAGVGYVDHIICPVGEPHSSIYDSWLAPRDGGTRLHQGNDILAPTGTPLYAVVSGYVTQKTNRFGGITISLMGDNGNRYYYAHLAAWEGGNGWVPQGTVIGYVGDTGNATGIPHLHFQIMPGNGVPVNPTPSLIAGGC
ncbi:MAG TPA: peptidoglycan DD-metalloendopeptidase family protein [Ilumatobacter sp.]|nr:peptidoglycan DD-metalloendopeptidase family protein [Ilumatobacter sp.]